MFILFEQRTKSTTDPDSFVKRKTCQSVFDCGKEGEISKLSVIAQSRRHSPGSRFVAVRDSHSVPERPQPIDSAASQMKIVLMLTTCAGSKGVRAKRRTLSLE